MKLLLPFPGDVPPLAQQSSTNPCPDVPPSRAGRFAGKGQAVTAQLREFNYRDNCLVTSVAPDCPVRQAHVPGCLPPGSSKLSPQENTI